MPYGIILLPDALLAEKLTSFSNEIAGAGAIMSLDVEKRPPHLTLLHIDADEEEVANQWWSGVAERIEPSLSVSLTGLMFNPIEPNDYYAPEGGLYFGIEARSTSLLREAHAITLEQATKCCAKPLSGSGDRFAPHITLGILRSFPNGISLRSNILNVSFSGRLALGHLGNYGTFPEILNQA